MGKFDGNLGKGRRERGEGGGGGRGGKKGIKRNTRNLFEPRYFPAWHHVPPTFSFIFMKTSHIYRRPWICFAQWRTPCQIFVIGVRGDLKRKRSYQNSSSSSSSSRVHDFFFLVFYSSLSGNLGRRRRRKTKNSHRNTWKNY